MIDVEGYAYADLNAEESCGINETDAFVNAGLGGNA